MEKIRSQNINQLLGFITEYGFNLSQKELVNKLIESGKVSRRTAYDYSYAIAQIKQLIVQNQKLDNEELKRLQSLSLEEKIIKSLDKIRQYYEILDGHVYVSVSGGKDSTVLLHLTRALYPHVKAMFVDTGLEYPENKELVRTISNVDWVRPKKTFYQVIQEEGYPVPSKEQALFINDCQTTKSPYLMRVRFEEGKFINFEPKYQEYIIQNPNASREEYYHVHKGKYPDERISRRCRVSDKWKFLATPPFKYKVTDKCCNILKKNPAREYSRKTKLFPITGEMAVDSGSRKRLYIKKGCNALSHGDPKSTPLGFWLEKDVWDYIHKYNLPYSKAYDNGLDRTGCIFCLFGIAEEKVCRFRILKKFHPELYDYCMNKLGIKEVLEYLKENGINIDYESPITSMAKKQRQNKD